MAGNWAYTYLGRVARHDFWDHFGTQPSKSSNQYTIETALRNAVLNGNGRDRMETMPHVIAFDGEKWTAGYHAYPKDFLDPQKFPSEFYNFEHMNSLGEAVKTGRPLDQYHGYVSDSAAFPEMVPNLDKQKVAALHEKNIIPIWDASANTILSRGKSPSQFVHTSFEPLSDAKSIHDHLPPDAVEVLRKAHAEKKPIALQYDPSNMKWAGIERFDYKVEQSRALEKKTLSDIAQRSAQQTTPKPSTAATEEVGKGFAQRFKDIKPTGKTAIIGGSVALAGLIGYWVFKMRQEKAQKSRDRDQQQAGVSV